MNSVGIPAVFVTEVCEKSGIKIVVFENHIVEEFYFIPEHFVV